MMSKQQELKPTIIASLANISDWEQVFNGLVIRLSLSDFLSEDENVRDAAALTMVDPSIPPANAGANWISIEAFQIGLHGKFPGQGQIAIAKRAFVDSHLDKLFTAAVQRSVEVKGNVLSIAQWLVNSVTTENLLPIFGTLRYDDIYGRKKAITTRFRVSNRHGVILCLTKLLELKMVKDTQQGCHAFMDQIRSYMLRLRTHLAAGGLDLVSVLEIMVLIQGLPKYGGWPVFAMSLSTDETLSFDTMCERLQQQADRLSSDKSARTPQPGNNSNNNGTAKSVSGGGSGGSAGNGGGKPSGPYKPKTYWNGQNSKSTYQKH